MNAHTVISASAAEFVPPGRLVSGKDGPRWEGQLTWTRRHGEHARTTWLAGLVSGVTGAMLPDGSRGYIFKTGAPETGGWRRAGGDGGWTHGRLEVTDDEVLFVDDTEQPSPRRLQAGSIGGDLARSSAIMDKIGDLDFAADLYGALCSIGWRKVTTGKEYWGTWRRAAETVVALRGLRECYTDYFLMGNEGLLTAEVRDALGDIGWTHIEGVDAESRARRALNIVETCEARPVGETPEWYRLWANGLSYGPELDNRMHVCALSGRANLHEWELFWECFEIPAE